MNELNKIEDKLTIALEEIKAYNEKPTKASSKRIRLMLGDIKNSVVATRAELVAADKA
jgi:hypothetical protein